MALSRYRYSEVGFFGDINNIPEEDGLWCDQKKMHSFITWSNVKAIAKRNLTDKQYYVFVKRGRDGYLYREFEDDLGISLQSSQERLDLAIKKLRKIFEKYLKTVYNIEGGFKFHVRMEKKIRSGEYFDRFEEK